MKRNSLLPSSLLALLFALSLSLLSPGAKIVSASEPKPGGIKWVGWSEEIFEEASSNKKLVVLDLEAIWCHWCHVMEEKTYSNSEVKDLISKHFIAVRVDQDSRPDLSNRYRDYGWPATIFFGSDGKELAKRAGFVEPEEMAALLKKLIADPKPEEEQSTDTVSEKGAQSTLSAELEKELLDRYEKAYDRKSGGLKMAQKYIDADTIEYSLTRPKEKNQADVEIARLTLDNNLKLLDPIWGGFYQYSTHYDWDHPHFEKIMSTQSNNMRLYSLAYALTGEKRYLEGARKVQAYIRDFLTGPDGAFYTSQDADVVKGEHSAEYFELDDIKRRERGIPAIDKHNYSRENGMMIRSLVALYGFGKDASAFEQARKAATWIEKNRKLDGGGFSHDAKDPAGPYLGDTLEMGRAFLDLYGASGERSWLKKAEESAGFIRNEFMKEGGAGFYTSSLKTKTALEPIRLLAENIQTSRFLNLLSHYTGKKDYKELAERGMRYLAVDKVALDAFTEPGILSADQELSRDPLHITIVGRKDDDLSKSLFAAALQYPSAYKRLEWWDKREGPMPNPDVTYPEFDKPAAFICTNKRCSLPIFAPEKIASTVDLFEKSASRI